MKKLMVETILRWNFCRRRCPMHCFLFHLDLMFCSCCAFGVDRVENECREGLTIVTQHCFKITTIFHISAKRISNVPYLSIDKFVNNSKKEKKKNEK